MENRLQLVETGLQRVNKHLGDAAAAWQAELNVQGAAGQDQGGDERDGPGDDPQPKHERHPSHSGCCGTPFSLAREILLCFRQVGDFASLTN